MHEGNYIKVRVSKILDPSRDILFSENLKGKGFSQEFNQKLYESEDEEFRPHILTFLDEAVGANWAVLFNELSEDKYEVDLYSDNGQFEEMAQIIKERVPSKIFTFSNKGTVADYLSKY